MSEQSRFDRLAETSDDTLLRNIERTDNLLEDREREDDYHLGKHFKKIKTAALWCAFTLGVFIVFVLCGAFLYLFWLYILDTAKTAQSVQSFVFTAINSTLLVLATLFAERLFGKKET